MTAKRQLQPMRNRKNNTTISSAKSRQRGVGMMEILVAVLVISVGFLAAAQMQVRGLRFTQTAYFLSQANFMLNDIADRMRSNREGVIAGEYAGFTTNGSTGKPACVASANQCNVEDLADADKHAWSAYLYDSAASADFIPLLPSGDAVTASGSITEDEATGVHTITVTWSEYIDGAETAQSLSRVFFP